MNDDRAELRTELEAWLCAELKVSRVVRMCPRCGSSGHGRPVVLGAPRGAGGPPWVSLSYADGLGVAAWTWDGPVGVDAEVEGPAVGEFGDRSAWTHAEAVLKASGAGVARMPQDLPPMWARPLELPAGWVGTVAVAGVDDPVVTCRSVGPAARPR
jgi:4'-phosphopantetheinyl transferase